MGTDSLMVADDHFGMAAALRSSYLSLFTSTRYNRRCMAIDLAALAKFDTPTICNTIELFAVRSRTAGYMDGRVRACFPEMAPAVGYAATAPSTCCWRGVPDKACEPPESPPPVWVKQFPPA